MENEDYNKINKHRDKRCRFHSGGKEAHMLSSKRRNAAVFILLAAVMLTACGRNQPSDAKAEEIIHDFWQGDYEYTQTVYSTIGEEQRKLYGETRGKLISDPYQQYERAADASEQGITEQYWYTRDGQVVYNFKAPTADSLNHWTTIQSGVKGSCAYIKEGQPFVFDREETISGRKSYVYRARFEEEYAANYSRLPEEERNGVTEIAVPYRMDVEYYIDFSENEVVRIRLDMTDAAKAGEIANLMFSGMTREEAEEQLRQNGTEETYEMFYDIQNFNGPVEINAPQDLEEL